jgi:hypothetical protein
MHHELKKGENSGGGGEANIDEEEGWNTEVHRKNRRGKVKEEGGN